MLDDTCTCANTRHYTSEQCCCIPCCILSLLAHLWCAYAMALCLSWIVRLEVGCVCVEHNYPMMWMD